MTEKQFKAIAPSLPADPGVYRYYDQGDQLIYVGKAKNLKKRISSYFTKTLQTFKTREMVTRIARIECTVVNSEQDAFLLENALIKEHQPKYNINLRDDKSFPYIVLKNEPFPRVFLTRRVIDDGSEYLGPYTSAGKVRELLTFIKQTIQLRNCSLNLSEKNIRKGKFKVCLEYHLGNCKGPCEELQTEEDYAEGLRQLRNLLKGNLSPVVQHFRKEMKQYAADLAFEKAEQVRQKITFLENYQARSVIVNKRLGDLDVFSQDIRENTAYVNYLMVRNGVIIQTHTNRFVYQLDERPEELLLHSVARIRSDFHSDAPELVLPFPVSYPDGKVRITVPKSGDKKKLLELSEKNLAYYLAELEAKKRLRLSEKTTDKHLILQQVRDDLQLPGLPEHIECFDNSNFQGSYPVAAMVCFREGVPSKKDYRHFNIKTVSGINDFASMKEAVSRRYRRLDKEGASLPQLVIIDGGKGQLSAAVEAIRELGLDKKMTVVGLAKNEEEIFYPGDQQSLKLPLDSASLKFIRGIRDEVHRFGITFHRDKRSKGTFTNELESIPGIGKSLANQLLKAFRSVKTVKDKSLTELSEIIPAGKAKMVFEYFHGAGKKKGPG